MVDDLIEVAVKKARQEERERAAKIVKAHADNATYAPTDQFGQAWRQAIHDIAKVILNE